MEYMQLVIISILIEAIWENIKMSWNEKTLNVNMFCVLIISIIVCLITGIDIFPIVGISVKVPYIGSALTGIIVSRGANFVNDLFSKLNKKGN